MKKNYYKDHQNLLKQCLKALQKSFPEARFFQRHVGMFYTKNNTPIKINEKGMADAWGIINGKHVEIEFKTGQSRQTKEQKQWEKITNQLGGKYYLIRSLQDLDLIIQDHQG